MSDAHRLSLLKQAQFRSKQTARCRMCGGTVLGERPYCLRHFRILRGGGKFLLELKHAVAQGQRLDEADSLIHLREQFPNAYSVTKDYYQLSPGISLRSSAHEWVWRERRPGSDEETEFGRYPTLLKAFEAVLAARHLWSVQNRYATKTLIR